MVFQLVLLPLLAAFCGVVAASAWIVVRSWPRPLVGPRVMAFMKRSSVGRVALCFSMLVYLAASLVYNWDCVTPKLLLWDISPDGTRRLNVESRTRFPRSEFVDPSTSLEFLLVDVVSGHVISKTSTILEEESDFMSPSVTWRKDSVRVTGFDWRHSVEICLPIGR